MVRSAAYEQGYNAYLGKRKERVNPYPANCAEYSDWWDGFNAAQADCAW